MIIRNCTELEATGLVAALYTEGLLSWVGSYDRQAHADAWENMCEVAQRTGISPERMVRADQKHTNIIRTVTAAESGEGVARTYTTGPHDGLVTDVPGIMLCTAEADCLPIYLLDPVHRAIGMVHSGWRGTAALIGPAAVARMGEEYGTRPQDLLVSFGPSICGSCYEVGEELREDFSNGFNEREMETFFTPCGKRSSEGVAGSVSARSSAGTGKYLLDNAAAARLSLVRCGVAPERIADCGICTYEHAEFASFRRSGDIVPHLLTAIMLL